MNFISPVELSVSADLKRPYLCLPSLQSVRRDFYATKKDYRSAGSEWMRQFLLGHMKYLLWVYRQQREATWTRSTALNVNMLKSTAASNKRMGGSAKGSTVGRRARSQRKSLM